jgi:glutamine synthetase
MTRHPEIDELMAALRAQGIHSVLAQFTDLLGVPKGKLVPLEHLHDMVQIGAGFSGPSIWGTGLPRMGVRSEYHGRVQAHTLQALPFWPGVARAVCDGFAGGEPLETCSRQVLKRQLARLHERGLTLWVGVEPEFFLLRQPPGGATDQTPWQLADPADHLPKPSYDVQSLHRQRVLLDDLRQTLKALGFVLEQIDHEDANAQYEINYRHDDALAAADRFQLFKMAVQAVAQQHGLHYSGMPKPLTHAPGSGLHLHLSLSDAQGRAVMANPEGTLGLSDKGLRFASGLLNHADALTALCAPTVNSYKRLTTSTSASGTTWAPVWKAIGDNNRTCALRTVAGRLEWRVTDPSCNLYLALAAIIAAGLDGLDHPEWPLPLPCDDDLYERHAQGGAMPTRLPRDLCAALDALVADAPLRGALGQAVCDEFLHIKRQEWDAYAQHVSAWEWQRYAVAF